MALFDSYVIVDWSAANSPKRGKDSIWIGVVGASEALENPPTRAAATERIGAILQGELTIGRRTLVGFDFSLGFPVGTARELGLEEPAWRATWEVLRGALDEDDRNRGNRFDVAAELNRRISGGRGPFWGCPKNREQECLGSRKADRVSAGLPELRVCDGWVKGPQSVWKLYTAGAVGSQTLTGIPRAAALRERFDRSRVWPFETDLKAPAGTPIVFAEVYPTLARFREDASLVKDAQQVRALARLFKAWDCCGYLAELFAGPRSLKAEQRRAAVQEEGWILGVL